MKKIQTLVTSIISASCILAATPAKAELSPEVVIRSVYEGIQQIHGYQATPRLVWGVDQGARGGCGRIRGTHYCRLNHTVYLTNQDTRMAYQHGDAALGYIIAHEYAHAMQVAYGFMPGKTVMSELQADCLAGAYLASIPGLSLDERDIKEIATFAYRVGDHAVWSRQHHGTPVQRVKAVATGLQSSMNGKGLAACRL
jgi:uncharacterized protein